MLWRFLRLWILFLMFMKMTILPHRLEQIFLLRLMFWTLSLSMKKRILQLCLAKIFSMTLRLWIRSMMFMMKKTIILLLCLAKIFAMAHRHWILLPFLAETSLM